MENCAFRNGLLVTRRFAFNASMPTWQITGQFRDLVGIHHQCKLHHLGRTYPVGPRRTPKCPCFFDFTIWTGRIRPLPHAVRNWGLVPLAGVLATDPLGCVRCGGRWFYPLAGHCWLWQCRILALKPSFRRPSPTGAQDHLPPHRMTPPGPPCTPLLYGI